MPLIPTTTTSTPANEPTPPPNHIRHCGHHWLDVFNSDGEYGGRVILQWNASVMRWSNSGMVGTGIYINTGGWKYVCSQEIPD